MPQRRYGPTQGAGVAIVEKEGEKIIQAGKLGTTVYTGILEKGNVGELITCLGKGDMIKKTGGFIPDSFLPDCSRDFYDSGNGAGELHLMRVTDGSEIEAVRYITGRIDPDETSWDLGFKMGNVGELLDGTNKAPDLARFNMKNGGKWGGQKRVFGHSIEEADIGTNTVVLSPGDSGDEIRKDLFKGGELFISAIPGKTYKIIGSTETVPITVSVELNENILSDLAKAGGFPAYGKTDCIISMVNETETGDKKEVTFFLKPGALSSDYWGLEVYVDGIKTYDYSDLSTDPNNKYYYKNLINADGSNTDFEVEDLWSGAINKQALGRNYSGIVLAAGSPSFGGKNVLVDFNGLWGKAVYTPVTDTDIEVDMWSPSATLSSWQPGVFVATCTATGAPGSETWSAKFYSITEYKMLQEGTLDAENEAFGFTYQVKTSNDAFKHPLNHCPDITIKPLDGGFSWNKGATVTIGFEGPAPGSLTGWYFLPEPLTAPNTRYRVVDNTILTVTLKASVDLTEVWSGVFDEADVEADAANPAASANVELESPLTAAFNKEERTVVIESVGAGNKSTWTINVFDDQSNALPVYKEHAKYGEDPVLVTQPFTPVDGEVYTAKFSNGDIVNFEFSNYDNPGVFAAAGTGAEKWEITNGYNPYYELQFPQAAELGYDGIADISDTDYTDGPYDVDSSPVKSLFGQKKGLVKLATPGVTSTAVQKAGVALAEAFNYQYRYEIPYNYTAEDQAASFVENTLGRNDFAVVSFPSYGYVSDPEKDGLKLIPLTGMIHGREAGSARDYNGFHKPAAGIFTTLTRVLSLPTGDKVLNEEFLNPKGIGLIKKYAGNFIVWGNRTLALDPTWTWKHQRELMSHYEHDLQESFDWIIFMLNNKDTWGLATAALKSYFIPEYSKGAITGDSFEEAAQIKIDEDNNSKLEAALGNLHASVTLSLVDAVERFIITIGKAGIFEDSE